MRTVRSSYPTRPPARWHAYAHEPCPAATYERAGAPRTLWHDMPAAMEKSRCGYVGLKNLGATCYLNALVQQLFIVPEFRTRIIELPVLPGGPPSPPEKGSAAPQSSQR